MLNNIRNFSKTIFAKILLVIIIIPFVFWGMGGVFSGGDTNNIASINKNKISTQDFIDYLNSSNIENQHIRDNIDKNIVEEVLADLISKKMVTLEIADLNLNISDEILKKIIIENKNFLDENNKFSRIKYEKFLLSSNINAPQFEKRLKESELRKKLFSYINGGIKAPFFLTNKIFKNETKKININYINLKNLYKKKESFSDIDIDNYIDKNKDKFQERKIDFNYSKITTQDLVNSDEFNQDFFNKIDKIENEISNNYSYKKIVEKYKLNSFSIKNFSKYYENIKKNEDEKIFNIILKNSVNKKIELTDQNDYFLFFEVTNEKYDQPSIKNLNFKREIIESIYKDAKFEYNRNLIKNISDNKFSLSNFNEIAMNNSLEIKNINLDSIKDNKKFTIDGIKYIYSLKKNDFTLVADNFGDIYLINILSIVENNISKNSNNYEKYKKQTNMNIRNEMYGSYDFFLNEKYKIKINQKTLDRVKNYFR